MSAKRLEKSEVQRILEATRQQGYEIWAPVAAEGGAEFRLLAEGEPPFLDYSNARLSPKALVFPQSERMFTFSADRTREDAFILKELPEKSGEQLLFGIRPCDARSFVVLDKVFLVQGACKDPYYLRKRDRILAVGLGCNTPCATCFCHWTGGGPFSTEGLDLLMTDLGGGYLIRSISKKGETLLDGMDLAETSQLEVEKAREIAEEALAALGPAQDPGRIRNRPLMEAFADPYWETAHEPCIKCGTCTFLCPTCSCFDIQDELHGRCGLRGRNWETCMFPLTTMHASGHNPRPTGKERFRQRFMHKLKYFLDDFQTLMCVGCGRCIQYCPVNIDIREIITAMSA